MFLPMTERGEWRHRKQKREWEGSEALEAIEDCMQSDLSRNHRTLSILEFGCGRGFQIPYLQRIGDVVASDVRASREVQGMKGIRFIICSAESTPFRSGQFDIIFSNHVIEHIENLATAFVELRRIGAEDCLFAFSVPTSYWLLLSVPARYYTKVRLVLRCLFSRGESGRLVGTAKGPVGRLKSFLRFIHPGGHGMGNFFQCFWAFRIRQWKHLLNQGGFSIIRTHPLLLYGSSKWPLVPTTRPQCRWNVCSSVLFLMKRTLAVSHGAGISDR